MMKISKISQLSQPLNLLLLLLMSSMAVSRIFAKQHPKATTDSSSSSSKIIRCFEGERQALLQFKQGLVDDYQILKSWGSPNCCDWRGVGCSNITGHVISLDLRASGHHCDGSDAFNGLRGNIGTSLLELKHLSYLDLSGNNFSSNPIPKFIGSLGKLKYLNLACSNFIDEISYQFKNLSNLEYLNLNDNLGLYAKNFTWASTLRFLKTLNLEQVDLSDAIDWVHEIFSFPSLTNLNLHGCSLSLPSQGSKSLAQITPRSYILPNTSIYSWLFNISRNLVKVDLSFNNLNSTIPKEFVNINSLVYLDLSNSNLSGTLPKEFGNLSSLSYLDLSENLLMGPIPETFGGLTSLRHLHLSGNQLQGPIHKRIGNLSLLFDLDLSTNRLQGAIPQELGSLSNLQFLGLSNNQLEGTIPNSFGYLHALETLELSNNNLTGSLPDDFGQLSKLQMLRASSNSLNGIISEVHLSNLSSLTILDLSFNNLAFHVSPNWTPPFQLLFLWLDSCKLGPHFPYWLQTQDKLALLSISDAGISDSLPEWFWGIFTQDSFIVHLNLSYNKIHGTIPDSGLVNYAPDVLDFSFNSLEGSIPLVLARVGTYLDVSNNRLSGLISSCSLTTNSSTDIYYFDLSNNNLSGELPDCWMYMNRLEILDLGNNSFSGKIPNSFGCLNLLEILNLGSNQLSGEVPSSLKHCTSLRFLDLSENLLSGQVPSWLGNKLLALNFLILRQNKFSGSFPLEMCRLSDIQVLDLSVNNIVGTIPICLYNLSYMSGEVTTSDPDAKISEWFPGSFYFNMEPVSTIIYELDIHAYLVWKGSRREYWKNMAFLTSIDLSSNKLEGEIPAEISHLTRLHSLNLSRNHLIGPIPPKLGQLKDLESLDLSRNQLSGEIPASFAELDFLGVLDLSYNNLSGKIPSGTQLQGFNESTYMGNRDLCGLPLPKKCEKDATQTTQYNGEKDEDENDEFLSHGFYASIGLGFNIGFWGACGILWFKISWRNAYFRFCSRLYDMTIVTLVVYIIRPTARLWT